MQAKDVMTKDVITVQEGTPIEQIVTLMVEYQISGVPVVDDDNLLVGIVTEHDLLYKKKHPISISWAYNFGAYSGVELDEERCKMRATTASEIMSKRLLCVEEHTPLVEIVRLMICKGVKRVLVARGRELLGIVSKADVLKVLVAEMKRGEIVGASQGYYDQDSDNCEEGYAY